MSGVDVDRGEDKEPEYFMLPWHLFTKVEGGKEAIQIAV